MTYDEAIALYPYETTLIQVDDVIRQMTPAEYESFIKLQMDTTPLAASEAALPAN